MGVYVGAYSRGDANHEFLLGVHDELMRLLSVGDVRAVVDREVDLSGIAEALGQLRDRKVIGRIVARPA